MTVHITSLRSPGYTADFSRWLPWREAVAADATYVTHNLQKQPGESYEDFEKRRKLTPTPAYIKATLREILTGILVHMELTARAGGPNSFQSVIGGTGPGVDGSGTSLNYFMVMHVLRELLIMRRVGIFVDRPQLPVDATVLDAAKLPPYMYLYTAEQILAWSLRPGHLNPEEILLRREIPKYHPGTLIATEMQTEYLHGHKPDPGLVVFDIYDQDGNQTASHMQELESIPFIFLETSDSLVDAVLGHQSALLNLGSSGVVFAIASNLAVYTEQSDMAWLVAQLKQVELNEDSAEEASDIAGQIKVGLNRGRRYAQNSERPEFITPDNENLQRTLEYYKFLQEDIRRIMLLTIQNLSARGMLTATGLMQSQASVSNGLMALAALLEKAENQIGKHWAEYENTQDTYTVRYPRDFQVTSPADRDTLVKALSEMRELVPSREFREQVTERLASLILGPQVAPEIRERIKQQIKASPVLIGEPKILGQLVEDGICPREYATQALSLPADAAEKANNEHAERLARIAQAQAQAPQASAARGNSDGIDDAIAEKTASQSADQNPAGGKRVRS